MGVLGCDSGYLLLFVVFVLLLVIVFLWFFFFLLSHKEKKMQGHHSNIEFDYGKFAQIRFTEYETMYKSLTP